MNLEIDVQSWPIAGTFTISRGAKTQADVVVATVSNGGHIGHGECVPYKRYGETLDGAVAALEALKPNIAHGLTRAQLRSLMPPGAARNALDSALLDLEAKTSGIPAWKILGLPEPKPVITAFTLSLAEPAAMALAAKEAAHRPLLKLKLGPEGALERVRAVRGAAPQSALIVDANEAWSIDALNVMAGEMATLGVALIEQPLPAGEDSALEGRTFPIPLCADESVHGLASLNGLAARYQYLNIKLDKTGGPTEAAAMAQAARAQGLKLMVGCMVGTSLGMAPAFLLASLATFVDLDGPLLLAKDREPAIRYEGSLMFPPPPGLWG